MIYIYNGQQAHCIQNGATGREATIPHRFRSTNARKKVVIIWGGPAGLEAARVSAERGHAVVLFEAQAQTGGQVNLAATATWRTQLQQITDWLEQEARLLGVDTRLNTPATVEMVLAEMPDYVIVATGGSPNKGYFEGSELAVSSWDILKQTVPVAQNVLIYDDHSGHQALSCAEFVAQQGSMVEMVTPEMALGRELGGTSFAGHLEELYKLRVKISPDLRLNRLAQENGQLVAVLENEYSHQEEVRYVEQVIAEHGTLPNDALYFGLKPRSTSLGEVDLTALTQIQPQTVENNPAGTFRLFRVGDAVTSRNIHAAIYDSLRLCAAF